jgi:hypothetical protein
MYVDLRLPCLQFHDGVVFSNHVLCCTCPLHAQTKMPMLHSLLLLVLEQAVVSSVLHFVPPIAQEEAQECEKVTRLWSH